MQVSNQTCTFTLLPPSCPNLKLTGLMTIGDLGNSEAASTTVEAKYLKIFGSVNISTLLQKISRHRNIYIQSKALSSFLRSRCSMLIIWKLSHFCSTLVLKLSNGQGDNPDFRTLLDTRGAVAAALGKVWPGCLWSWSWYWSDHDSNNLNFVLFFVTSSGRAPGGNWSGAEHGDE